LKLHSDVSQLTDVEAGGRTAFPLIGVGVNPQAGSGLLWYNFDENIIRDDKMIHGACPLILGGPKWGRTGNMTLKENAILKVCNILNFFFFLIFS